LVRYLPDGNIEFLGRIHQVKAARLPHRTWEIEAVLSHPLCDRLLSQPRGYSGDKRLVAYVVLYQEHALTLSELRRFLKEQLPEYMVPSAL